MGICVTCRKVICSECLTRIQGIIHCRDCLLGKLKKDREWGLARIGGLFIATVLLVSGLFLSIWFFSSIGRIATTFPDSVRTGVLDEAFEEEW